MAIAVGEGSVSMIDHRPRLPLTAGPPANPGERCGSWPLQLAPQLTKVRASVEELARRRYAHPSLDAPEPSLLGVLERLALVVSELGGNALRHAQAPVTISLSRLPRGWLLNVSDGDPATAPLVEPAHGRSRPEARAGGRVDRVGRPRLVRRRGAQACVGGRSGPDP